MENNNIAQPIIFPTENEIDERVDIFQKKKYGYETEYSDGLREGFEQGALWMIERIKELNK